MRKKHILSGLFLALLLVIALLIPAGSQQEVVLTIREGVPAISLAVPPFIYDGSIPRAKEAAETIHQVLQADLNYSRVFFTCAQRASKLHPPPQSKRNIF